MPIERVRVPPAGFFAPIQPSTATLAELAAVDVSTFVDGFIAYVPEVEDSFALVQSAPASLLARADGLTIVLAAGGAAAWIRAGLLNREAWAQANWYVETTGDDANDGAAPASPLRTLDELARRLHGAVFSGNVTIWLGPGTFGALELGDVEIPAGVVVTLQGTVTDSAPNTIATVTNQAPATAVRGAITTAAGAFTLWERLRLTSGASSGARAWVTNVIAPTDANVSRWWRLPADAAVGKNPTLVNATVGADFVSEQLDTTIGRVMVRVHSGGRVLFRDLVILPSNFGVFSEVTNAHSDFNSGVAFFGCAFRAASFQGFQQSQLLMVGCAMETTVFWGTVRAELHAMLVRAPFSISQSALLWNFSAAFAAGGRLILSQIAIVNFAGGATNGDFSWFNSAGTPTAIETRYNSVVTAVAANTRIWGAGTFTTCTFLLNSTSWLSYVTQPTLTGGASDARIGGANKTYAELPFADAARNCGIGLSTL